MRGPSARLDPEASRRAGKGQAWMSDAPAWKPGLCPDLGQGFSFLVCKMGMMIIELTS